MDETDALTGLYDYLVEEVKAPANFDDLLRSKIVYSVSAFDKLMHDTIRKGMVEIYKGNRSVTQKYLSEPIQMGIVNQLISTTTPPPEVIFEQAVRAKLKTLSFQDPDKIADGLSYIWAENQKWQKISAAMGQDEKTLRTTLKLIASRRNAIVHEADIDPVSDAKIPITRSEAKDIVDLLRQVGETIRSLVG